VNESQTERDVQRIMKGPPRGYFVVVPQQHAEEEAIDLAGMLYITRRSWQVLVGMMLAGAVIAAVISLLMRSTYRAQAIIAPVEQNVGGAAGALKSQFGGLAALAGIDLGSAGGRKDESFATLSSPGFARDFIVQHNLMPILFADNWDPTTKQWRTDKKRPKLEEGVKKFTNDIRSLSEDKKSGIVTMTVEWRSPELAAQWANGMIDMVNDRLRSEATRKADQSIEYLNHELAKTSVVDLRQAIYRLIESQVNNAMVANVQRDYAFKFIDPAVPPESRASPKRTVMVIIGAVLGLFVGFTVILLRHRLSRSRDKAVAVG
jgi:LPS O-antigen subunit length determinant protein (WzzB/FepE family)